MKKFIIQSWSGVNKDPTKDACFDAAGVSVDSVSRKYIVVSDGAGVDLAAKLGAECAVEFTSFYLNDTRDLLSKLIDSGVISEADWRKYSIDFCSALKVRISELAKEVNAGAVERFQFTLLIGVLSFRQDKIAWLHVGDGSIYLLDGSSSLRPITSGAGCAHATILFWFGLPNYGVKSGIFDLAEIDWRVIFATSDGMDDMIFAMIEPDYFENRNAMLNGFLSGSSKACWGPDDEYASRDEYLKAMLAADIWGADDRSLAAIIRLESSADDSRAVAPVFSDSHNSSPACPVSLIKVSEGRSSVELEAPSGDCFTGDSEKSIGIKKLSEGNARKASSGDFRSILPWFFVMMLAPVFVYYWIEDFNNVAKIRNLEDGLRSANVLNGDFRRGLAERDASIAGLNADLVRAKMKLDEVSKDREKYMDEISDALRESGDFKKKNQALEARVNSLRNEIDLKSREIERLAEKVDKLEKEKLMAPRVNPSFPASGGVGYK